MPDAIETRIEILRRFNRFYSLKFKLLAERLLDTEFSLSEARVLYELAQSRAVTATALCQRLDMDRGYVSRILKKFEDGRLVQRRQSNSDARQYEVSLSTKGKTAFSTVNQASVNQIRQLLWTLPDEQQGELVEAIARAHRLLEDRKTTTNSFVLRPPQAGDFGWIVSRHGYLYAKEHGWNVQFEALVAEIVADYIKNATSFRDTCWIAEVDGQRAGCAFVVSDTDDVARFRLLLVEPQFRRMGIGKRLIEECIRFAKSVGYDKAKFWTNSPLKDARRLYDRLGFKLIEEELHNKFGSDMIGQTFEIQLAND